MTFGEFVEIIEEHGFELDRISGRHRQYEGFVDGERRMVTVGSAHRNEQIDKRVLASMIRQSGLPKKLFKR